MAKLNPTVTEGEERLDDSKSFVASVPDLLSAVRYDETNRQSWLQDKIESYQRRYAASNFWKKEAEFPWPGASNVNIPLSDIHIEELKPALLNLVFAGPRIYAMAALDGESLANVPAAEAAFDSMLKYRMPDFVLQKAYSIDALGTYGRCTEKTYYSYITEQKVQTIRRVDLPQRLGAFAVVDEVDPRAQQIAQAMGVMLMTRDDFDARAEQIESIVKAEYDLDPEDKVDAKSIRMIMSFLRSGSRDAQFVIKRRAVIENTPRLLNCPMENIVVPQGTPDIRVADRICHWMFFTESELQQRARDSVWNSSAVATALEGGQIKASPAGRNDEYASLMTQAKLDRLRVQAGTSQFDKLYRIGEIYCWKDIDGDGLAERCVITVEPKSGAVLKAIMLPFDHGEWPFVDTFLEATDPDRDAPRGVPQQIADMESHTTHLARGELNGLLIETTKSFTILDEGLINPHSFQWMPSLGIPVSSPDAVKPIDMAPRSLALESPMRNMMTLAERRISGSNRAVLDLPPPERRTAAEIDLFESSRQRVMTVRAMLYLHSMAKTGHQLFSLFRQYGPDSFYVYASGESPRKLTQAMIQGKFDIQPVGSVADLDSGYRAQQTLARLQIGMQMHPLLQNDPRYVHDLAALYLHWLRLTDPVLARATLHERQPQEIQQIMAQQQAMTQRAMEISDYALRALNNAPMGLEEANRLRHELIKIMPHGQLQEIAATGPQAAQRMQESAALAQQAAPNGRAPA